MNIPQHTELQSPQIKAIILLERFISLLTIIVLLVLILVKIFLLLLCPYSTKKCMFFYYSLWEAGFNQMLE